MNPDTQLPPTPARLARELATMVTRALGEGAAVDDLVPLLRDASARNPGLALFIAALEQALVRAPEAPMALLATVEPTLESDPNHLAYAQTLTCIAGISNLLGDDKTHLRARVVALAAFRKASPSQEMVNGLHNALKNLGLLLYKHEQYAEAIAPLDEAMAMYPPGQRDAQLRWVLENAREKAGQSRAPSLRAMIAAWAAGARDIQSLLTLLNTVANVVLPALELSAPPEREAVAAAIASLRALKPLPINGADDFLHVLQLKLRDEPDTAEELARVRAGLPPNFQEAIAALERMLAAGMQASR